MATSNADLVVIGGGSGGVRAARIAAGHGARVLLAEEYRMGGTCVIRGCVPKKLMVYASHFRRELDHAAAFGWTISPATFDWATLIDNVDGETERLEAAYTTNLQKAGVRVVKARAVLEDTNALRLATGETVRAGHILVATGSSPNHGWPIPGCHIVGPEAGEIIQVVGIAVKMKATKAQFDATMAVHPTAAEELVTMRMPTRVVSRVE